MSLSVCPLPAFCPLILSVCFSLSSSCTPSSYDSLQDLHFSRSNLQQKTPNQPTKLTAKQNQTPIPLPRGEVWSSSGQLSFQCHCDGVGRGRQAHSLLPCCQSPVGGCDEEVQRPRSECGCPRSISGIFPKMSLYQTCVRRGQQCPLPGGLSSPT